MMNRMKLNSWFCCQTSSTVVRLRRLLCLSRGTHVRLYGSFLGCGSVGSGAGERGDLGRDCGRPVKQMNFWLNTRDAHINPGLPQDPVVPPGLVDLPDYSSRTGRSPKVCRSSWAWDSSSWWSLVRGSSFSGGLVLFLSPVLS